jgi:hypothetical protein
MRSVTVPALCVWDGRRAAPRRHCSCAKAIPLLARDSGLDAWDVDRLIALSASFEVEEIDLSSVWEVDTVYWFDEREKPTVRKIIEHARLIQEVDLAHPIIVGPDGRVMDGMHRVARALLEGATTIRAVRFDAIPDPDVRNCRTDDLPYDERP